MVSDLVSMDLPSFEQLRNQDDDAPFEMLNMLRFRTLAEYAPDDPEFSAPAISGREAFLRYVTENKTLSYRAPGGITWQGRPRAHLITAADEKWDLVFLRSYDSVSSFVKMISLPEYFLARRHRTAALADSRLILCQQDSFFS